MLLAGVGGSLEAGNGSQNHCCDVCSPTMSFDSRLGVLQRGTTNKRKRRRGVRKASDRLKQKLVAVREEVYNERPSFSIVGIRFLCPDSTIDKICKEAKFIESIEDLSSLRIRPELKERFFNVISDTCDFVHRPRRQRLE